ncbi:unnamed protein product [Moneuplotes crassus]|uniref:Uncharacterized protein n=1 Tax=Euplotes crassus TaxID=5936 RepID=A0AAD1Y5R5_EUPCR|nr:unnamed protein product [Moneuplotes crassus]
MRNQIANIPQQARGGLPFGNDAAKKKQISNELPLEDFSIDISMTINDVSDAMSEASFLDFYAQGARQSPSPENINRMQSKKKEEIAHTQCTPDKIVCSNTKSKPAKKKVQQLLPVFECIFCAKTDNQLCVSNLAKLQKKYEVAQEIFKPSLTNKLCLTKHQQIDYNLTTICNLPNKIENLKNKETTRDYCSLKKSLLFEVNKNESKYFPVIVEKMRSNVGTTASKDVNHSRGRKRIVPMNTPQKNPNACQKNLLDLSSCVKPRVGNCKRKININNISFESQCHNIYDPNYSSSSESQRDNSEFNSFEISFELNKSHEELRLEHCFSMESKEGDKSIKMKNFIPDGQPYEPLLSIAPQEDKILDFKANWVMDTYQNNITKSTRQDSVTRKLPNESCDIHHRNLYKLNDQFSNFSAQLEFSRCNSSKVPKDRSIDQKKKFINLQKESSNERNLFDSKNNYPDSLGSLIILKESINLNHQLQCPDDNNHYNDKENLIPRLQLSSHPLKLIQNPLHNPTVQSSRPQNPSSHQT